MARLRQTYTVDFSIITTAEESLFELTPSDSEYTDLMTLGGSQRLSLLNSANYSVAIPAGAKFLYVQTDKPINVRLDTTVNAQPVLGTAFPVTPQNSLFPGRLVLFTTGITNLYVANPGSTSADNALVVIAFGA